MKYLRKNYHNFTATLSKRASTDVHYLTKNGLIVTAGQVGVMLTSLVLSVAFARYLSAEQFGTYQYIFTLAEFTAVLTLTGLSTSVVKSIARGFDGTMRAAIALHFKWSFSSLLIGAGISGYYFMRGNTLIGTSVLIGVIGTILIAAYKLYIPFLQGKQAFGLSSQYIVIGNLIPSLLLLIVVFYTDDILILISTYFFSHTGINYVLLQRAKRLISNNTIDPSVYSHSRHTTVQDFILDTSGHLDKILLFQFGNAATLAEYVFAVNIPRQFQMLFKSAKSIALPKLSIAMYANLRATLIKKVLLLYILVIPVTFIYIMTAPYIFLYLFPQYVGAVIYSQIYSLIFLLLPIRILKDAMLGHDKVGPLYKMTIITSLCKVVASLILIPLFSTWGLLWSLLITNVVYSILTIWYFLKSNGELPTTNQVR